MLTDTSLELSCAVGRDTPISQEIMNTFQEKVVGNSAIGYIPLAINRGTSIEGK